MLDDIGRCLDVRPGAGQLESVAAVAQGHAEARFDQFEVFIPLPAELGQPHGIVGLEGQGEDAIGRRTLLAQEQGFHSLSGNMQSA
ncbi:MAG: hypothetical protein U9Q35_02185 [Pseudomonadota bacterium]|nr:hypothetical protein [Pseudomonadota bacterium]